MISVGFEKREFADEDTSIRMRIGNELSQF
jgi:hypothetical protein